MKKRNKTQEWVNMAVKVLAKGESVVCPSCSSSNIHYKKTRITKDGLGFGLAWCEDCMRGVWISRMPVAEDSGEEPPTGIKYV